MSWFLIAACCCFVEIFLLHLHCAGCWLHCWCWIFETFCHIKPETVSKLETEKQTNPLLSLGWTSPPPSPSAASTDPRGRGRRRRRQSSWKSCSLSLSKLYDHRSDPIPLSTPFCSVFKCDVCMYSRVHWVDSGPARGRKTRGPSIHNSLGGRVL